MFVEAERLFARGEFGRCFNDVIDHMIGRGEPVACAWVRRLPWVEIDDADDLRYAKAVVYPALKRAFAQETDRPTVYKRSLGSPSNSLSSAGLG